MIELKIVEEQYARMHDEELVRFAMAESSHLTIESFHLLKAEFEKRHLDLGVLESVEIDRALTELNKQTTFEKVTAYEFTEGLWQFALDKKSEGMHNQEIFNRLLKKGVDEQYAFMLIQSLDIKAKQLAESYSTEIIIGWIAVFGGISTFMLVLSETVKGYFALYGMFIIFGGGFRLYKSYSKKEKYQNIQNRIEAEQNEVDGELLKN